MSISDNKWNHSLKRHLNGGSVYVRASVVDRHGGLRGGCRLKRAPRLREDDVVSASHTRSASEGAHARVLHLEGERPGEPCSHMTLVQQVQC